MVERAYTGGRDGDGRRPRPPVYRASGYFVMSLRAAALLLLSASAASAHLDLDRRVSPADRVEAARIARTAVMRTRRHLIEACLARETASLAGAATPTAEAAADVATAVFGRCSPVLEDYAASLLALAPLPGEGQAARLVASWKPYYREEISRRLLEGPPALRAADGAGP